MRGNCYVTCEALYHLIGGKRSGWQPAYLKHEGDTHWILRREGLVLDPTVKQFETKPDYTTAKNCGFLTKRPSRRARVLMQTMLWQP